MSRISQLGIVLVFLLFCTYLIFPTIQWYFLTDSQTKEILSHPNEKLYERVQEDIFQALKTVRTLSDNQKLPQEVLFLIPFAKDILKEKQESIPSFWNKATLKKAFYTEEDLENLKYKVYHAYLVRKNAKAHILNLGLDLAGGLSATLSLNFKELEQKKNITFTESEKNSMVLQTIRVLRERIDQFGLTEPQITREPSSNRIFVDIPGDPDMSRIQSFLKGSNSLSFHIVLDDETNRLREFYKTHSLERNLPEGFLKEHQKVFVQYQKDKYGFEDKSTAQYFVLSVASEDSFDGSYISSAQVAQDGLTHRPLVEFFLNEEGAEKFFNLTSFHTGNSMAIVFEEEVRSVARIQTGIAGGRVSISSESFSLEEANNLSSVLRSAAFPVEISIDDWRVIGPSLGEDNISSGVKALLCSALSIVIFMLFYYRSAGFISVIALIVNFFILSSLLSAFGLTLTLTSLAGLVLTVGMAVDTNVIIFERVKDEYRARKNMRESLSLGFKRALWTIVDANIATLVVAFFLSALGTGPVQGFAWTLAWGILTSLFTTVFLSRLLLQLWLDVFGDKISIAWGKKYASN